jgi:aspartate racemase
MQTIGLIGGMSWESSLEYYRLINQIVKEKLGGMHSAQSLMYSVDFDPIQKLQHKDEWDKLTEMMIDAAKRLEKGGADFVVICTNTMHKMAEDVEKNISLPLVHIADATAESIKSQKLNKIGLLGTKFTMEQDFYSKRLADKHQLDVIIPSAEEREIVHQIIYNELCMGQIKDDSKKAYQEIIHNLQQNGAEGVILGCTEIPLLIKQEDVSIPIFDTTTLHAKKAVERAMS